MTHRQAAIIARDFLREYARLCATRNEDVAKAAKRIGLSRARWYQVLKGQGAMSLAKFLTVVDELDRIKDASP